MALLCAFRAIGETGERFVCPHFARFSKETYCEVKMGFRAFIFLLIGLSLSAQEPAKGTLKGVVLGPTGGIAPETKIRIEDWYFDQGKPHVIADVVVYTNSRGEFSVPLAPGVYDVIVSRPDSEPFARKIEIVAGREAQLKPKLKGSRLAKFIE